MPAIEQSDRHQKAVLWPANGYDNNGRPTVGSPKEIRVRWLTNQTRVQDAQGNTISIDGTAIVDLKIAVGSQMWLGELEDWLGVGSGGTDNEMMEVKTYADTPDIKGRFTMRTVGLMRLHSKA